MSLAQSMPMPTFVARCLEEIGLEGRCGLSVRDMFALVDDANDLVYRRYAWKVLRGMGDQIKFHYLLRYKETGTESDAQKQQNEEQAARSRLSDSSTHSTSSKKNEKRRRKWSTTLIHTDEDHEQQHTAPTKANDDSDAAASRPLKRRRRRSDSTAVSDAENDQQAEEQEEQEHDEPKAEEHEQNEQEGQEKEPQQSSKSLQSGSTTHSSRSRSRSRSSGPSRSSVPSRSQATGSASTADITSTNATMDRERREWLARSPRGYDLGEELEVSGLSYEDAISETPDGVLGIVACAELRLKYLGVVDPSCIDTSSPQFDLLELIGRAREQGLNAAHVTESRLFGDARKMHYLLDMLVVTGFVVKNIVAADQKRFNILHLTRFVSRFHPSMVSPTATLEKDAIPKDQLPHIIAGILRSRGERTCVFADIGREFGFNKQQQEKLRKYFLHQMHMDASFPLEVFMARCNTGTDTKGRKLWCVRLRSDRTRGSDTTGDAPDSTGPVIERGIMEQMLASIEKRDDQGATIPEIRDMLGVPTFKLPYKLAQGLISNYKMDVEQVVLGKSTMYRMFAPGVLQPAKEKEKELPQDLDTSLDHAVDFEGSGSVSEQAHAAGATDATAPSGMEPVFQPSTLKEATRGMVVGSTFDKRKQFILDRVGRDKIVSIQQLRTGLVEFERPNKKHALDVGQIDYRSVRRLIDELEASKALLTLDITLPPQRVLQRSQKVVKCVALPDAHRDRTMLRGFIDGYFEEQQRKHMEGLHHENDAFIVVSNRPSKKKRMAEAINTAEGSGPVEMESKEVVKYSAATYKLARATLVNLHKQSRRLGMFFGIVLRVNTLHLLMWDRAPELRKRSQAALDASLLPATPTSQAAPLKKKPKEKELVFALKEVLDMLSVREYLQIVGIPELLTESEENHVRMAIARGDSWQALSVEIQKKIRTCEADRFSRLLRVLLELGLVQAVNDSSHDLLSVMQGTVGDFDQVISHVAFATLSGGLFQLKQNVRIAMKRGNQILKKLPSKHSYVYADGFAGESRRAGFTGRIPLEFTLSDAASVTEYWRVFKFLCLEGARLGTSDQQDVSAVSVNLDAELVRPAPLRDHNLYAAKVWVPRAATTYRASTERAKAVADVVGHEEEEQEEPAEPGTTTTTLKRKRYRSSAVGHSARVSGRVKMTPRKALEQEVASTYEDVDAEEGAGSLAASRWRRLDGWGGARSRIRADKWSSDDDVTLMDLYIKKLSTQWFIDIPLALQKRDERVAFRSTDLSRTKTSWKILASKIGRKRKDCMLRVKELLSVPAVQARVEKTKRAVTKAKNPGGQFHEELAIMKHPHLTALLCRALQIIFHERTSYYSFLADMLISRHWKEAEVKLVWRYLWLASVIARTTSKERNKGAKDLRQRGFGIHSHVFETKSLQLPNYSLDFFCDAAEYASFLQQNVKEAEMLEDEELTESNFEQEVEPNASSSQLAVDLAAVVMEDATFAPEFTPPAALMPAAIVDPTATPVAAVVKAKHPPLTLQESKRSLAIKGYSGHLSKRFDGALPDDFLKDFWSVKAKYGANGYGDRDLELSSMQAFSTSKMGEDHWKNDHDAEGVELTTSATWLVETLEGAGRNGMTMKELHTRFGAKMVQNRNGEATSYSLEKAVESAVSKRRCFEVNGSDAVRFVSDVHADLWTLKPYHIASDSTKDKVHFIFDQDRPIVARPWLHLDGSVNTSAAMMLKRRMVSIVMCCPGIPDTLIHQRMHRALTLQDTRCLLEELIQEDVVYARSIRLAQRHRTPQSVFDMAKQRPLSSTVVHAVAPGQLRSLDNSRDQLHYFPSVNCVELLGAAACDMDLGRSE